MWWVYPLIPPSTPSLEYEIVHVARVCPPMRHTPNFNMNGFHCRHSTSSTAQGGGGSFKNRKLIGDIGCCESGTAERNHWWTERCLISLSLFFVYLSLFFSLFLYLFVIIYLPTYWSICLSTYLSIYLSICLSVYLTPYLSIYLSTDLSI